MCGEKGIRGGRGRRWRGRVTKGGLGEDPRRRRGSPTCYAARIIRLNLRSTRSGPFPRLSVPDFCPDGSLFSSSPPPTPAPTPARCTPCPVRARRSAFFPAPSSPWPPPAPCAQARFAPTATRKTSSFPICHSHIVPSASQAESVACVTRLSSAFLLLSTAAHSLQSRLKARKPLSVLFRHLFVSDPTYTRPTAKKPLRRPRQAEWQARTSYLLPVFFARLGARAAASSSNRHRLIGCPIRTICDYRSLGYHSIPSLHFPRRPRHCFGTNRR